MDNQPDFDFMDNSHPDGPLTFHGKLLEPAESYWLLWREPLATCATVKGNPPVDDYHASAVIAGNQLILRGLITSTFLTLLVFPIVYQLDGKT